MMRELNVATRGGRGIAEFSPVQQRLTRASELLKGNKRMLELAARWKEYGW